MSPIRKALRDGAIDGSLNVLDVSAAASMVYGAVLVTGMQHLLVNDGKTIEDRSAALIAALLRGIDAPANRPPGPAMSVSTDEPS